MNLNRNYVKVTFTHIRSTTRPRLRLRPDSNPAQIQNVKIAEVRLSKLLLTVISLDEMFFSPVLEDFNALKSKVLTQNVKVP